MQILELFLVLIPLNILSKCTHVLFVFKNPVWTVFTLQNKENN